MSSLRRYTLFQIPGWILSGGILAGCWELGFISGRMAVLLFALWVLKDAVTYPLVRRAYEDRPGNRIEDLIGGEGVVQRPLAPRGLVRIRGELWRAEVVNSSPTLPPGSTIIVRAARGFTLIVEPVESSD